MEFNADRCQVRVVGSGSFAATMRRLRELHVAHQISFRDIAAFYDEGRLPDEHDRSLGCQRRIHYTQGQNEAASDDDLRKRPRCLTHIRPTVIELKLLSRTDPPGLFPSELSGRNIPQPSCSIGFKRFPKGSQNSFTATR